MERVKLSQKEYAEMEEGNMLFSHLEEKYPGLFCVESTFEEEGILCRVVQKHTEEEGLVSMIITNAGMSFAERMMYTLCGFYWYITRGRRSMEPIYTISRDNFREDFMKEAFSFVTEMNF